MKTIKTPLFTRKIEDSNPDVILFQLREILTDYRKSLISRLILDLPTYLDYRFKIKADKKQLEDIREKLYEVKNGSADLSKYDVIVQQVLANESTYISTQLFYHEIDRNISSYLTEVPLTLMTLGC
ncbi:MAG TPA: hypothetical protein VK517_17290 [Cyclobacteriaceae bacterium]|nr:hypothetical protein [Cyclobacteriaceae bacterium]